MADQENLSNYKVLNYEGVEILGEGYSVGQYLPQKVVDEIISSDIFSDWLEKRIIANEKEIPNITHSDL